MVEASENEREKKLNPAAEVVAKAIRSFGIIKAPPYLKHSDTKQAHDRLSATSTTVHSMLFTMCISRAIYKEMNKRDYRGRLSEADTDLLRGVIAFTGAGLDATLKQLIRDTVRDLIQGDATCAKKFKEFANDHLRLAVDTVHRGRLVELLLDERQPQQVLLERYVDNLTGDSLQSVDQVNNVCGALGVNDPELRKRLKEGGVLDQMFKARNKIVHELDLEPDGGRARRSLEEVRKFVAEAFFVTINMLNDVGKRLPKKMLDLEMEEKKAAAPPKLREGTKPA